MSEPSARTVARTLPVVRSVPLASTRNLSSQGVVGAEAVADCALLPPPLSPVPVDAAELTPDWALPDVALDPWPCCPSDDVPPEVCAEEVPSDDAPDDAVDPCELIPLDVWDCAEDAEESPSSSPPP